jgi:hypothetical protein
VPLCAWNNMLGSMQFQVRCMLGDFSILQIARAKSTWLDRTTWLKKTICLIYGVRITLDYGSSLVTGFRLVFSQCYVSDHFLVLFHAPSASLISFSIPTLAAGAGTIPSRAGYIQSMLTHSLVLTWFPWNCRVNGVCCLDPTPLQIMTL